MPTLHTSVVQVIRSGSRVLGVFALAASEGGAAVAVTPGGTRT